MCWYILLWVLKSLQAYVGDVVGLFLAHCNKVSMAIKRLIIFLFGGGSCLQSVKTETFVEHSKVMLNKRRYACS